MGAPNHTTEERRELPPVPPRKRALVIVHSSDAAAVGRTFLLDGSRYTFGRSASPPGRIADPRLSREHCAVSIDPSAGGYAVRDLESKNGTLLNASRLERPASLTNGAVLSIGDTLIVVDEEPGEELLPRGGADDRAAVEIHGLSFFTRALRRAVAAVAREKGSVLILGPTGTGKEVTARSIHRLSNKKGALVSLNCAALPSQLAESELFGHRKGAFTGADEDRSGHITLSSGGTLFLDEIGDLPLELQAKLLRVVEEQVVYPLGRGTPEPVDLRVVAATRVDIATSGFRTDLYARLGDWVLHTLPLAERRVDVLALFRHFAEELGAAKPFTTELAEALLLYDWPLNARELRQTARRIALAAGDDPSWDVPHLPKELQRPLLARTPKSSGAPDRAKLEAALSLARGNVKRAADELGVDRKSLYRWMSRHGIDPDSFR